MQIYKLLTGKAYCLSTNRATHPYCQRLTLIHFIAEMAKLHSFALHKTTKIVTTICEF